MEIIRKSFWCPHESDEESKVHKSVMYLLSTYCQDCSGQDKATLHRYCNICNKHWHDGCVPSSPDDISHPYHPYHPLQLLIEGPSLYSRGECDTCEEELGRFTYHCSVCNFNMHVRCSKNPPPLVVDAPKCHEHTLTLMARNDRFTCNACGTYGEQCPYVCAACSLMFHRDCTSLPHVININRHDDRISYTNSLGFGDWKCMICHKKIDWRYGAYSCAKCPSYVVHSKCATRSDVWDGVELEGVLEEFIDISPFKVIDEGVINHFSHEEHNLRFVEDGIERDKSVQCEACTHPIFSEKHYSCIECDYTLHETCANLPLRKRHGLSTTPLILISTKRDEDDHIFICKACNTISNGFRYKSGTRIELDVRCATVSNYYDHECHPHTIFFTTTDDGTCGGCHNDNVYVLNCVECDYSMCFSCATLPKRIRSRYDDHFLLLRYGEKAEGKYWCEVCETVLNPKEWFYTCDDCVVVCHIECLLGNFVNAKPGVIQRDDTGISILVSNNSMSRPKCKVCRSHCQLPLIVKYFSSSVNEVFCKFGCSANLQSTSDF